MNDVEVILMDHLRTLSERIGERPGGTPANHEAARYIGKIFQAAGLEVEEQIFPCPAWIERQTTLTMNGRPLEAAANAFSPPCNVSGPIVAASTLAELEGADLKGNIGVLYGDLCQAPLSPKSWFLKSEKEDKLIKLLEEKQPLALLTVQSDPNGLERLIEDWEFRIPSATVSTEAGLGLLKQDGATVNLRIDSEQTESTTANIVGRSAVANGRVVLCAHYDTKIDTPGAYDNGSGVAILLTLAQHLKAADYPFQLELVAFANEEYLPIGDDEYLRRNGEDLGDIIAAINIDGVGQVVGSNSITMISASEAFENAVLQISRNYPGLVWVDPWPESNHSTFAWRGVPSIAFGTTGGVRLQHRPMDTVDWIDPVKLKPIVELISSILILLKDKEMGWSRTPENDYSEQLQKWYESAG